jgi:peroxiredoxin
MVPVGIRSALQLGLSDGRDHVTGQPQLTLPVKGLYMKTRFGLCAVFLLIAVSCGKPEIPISMEKSWSYTIKFAVAGQHFFVYDPMDVRYKDFELPNLEGKKIKVSDLQGKAILLYFWNTHSSIKEKEIQGLKKLYEMLKDENVAVVSVNLGESTDMVREFVKKHDIRFPVLLDLADTLEKVYSRIQVPTAYLIDPDGFIAGANAGPTDWDTREMRAALRILSKKHEWKK